MGYSTQVTLLMDNTFLLYGSYGYTGSLIADQAVQRGLRPLLAGRDENRLRAQAQALGLAYRCFRLENDVSLDSALRETSAVLHCAGPFHRTYQTMVNACLRTGRHYLDITGEIAVFEELATYDNQARSAGVTLLPGVGFDVVPSDCLAAHLKHLLPSATYLRLAFLNSGRGVSRGTALTVVEQIGYKGMIRKEGKLVSVPHAWRSRKVDFGRGLVTVMTIPWGDVSTAYYSTGIPNISTYIALPVKTIRLIKLLRPMGWLASIGPAQYWLKKKVKSKPPGPNPQARQDGRSVILGEVEDEKGWRSTARLETPEGYTLTAQTATAAVERLMAGSVRPGFQTPSQAFGPDFIMEFKGVQREDL